MAEPRNMHNRIRHWRRARGLSQEALGRMVGLGKPTISKLERGELRLRDVTIAKLIDALGVEAGELLGDYAGGRGAPPNGAPKARRGTRAGFRGAGAKGKARPVHDVFSSVARRYDLMNDLMSGGIHRLWKADMVDWLRPRPGMRFIDVAGGTGDVALRILERAGGLAASGPATGGPTTGGPTTGGPATGGPTTGGPATGARVVVCDLTEAMLQVGRDRALDRGVCAGIDWLCGDAENLPVADASMDAYTIAFGIRNVSGIKRALEEARRVLKPGGRFLCLEFSRIVLPGLKPLYDAYSFAVLPALGEIVAADRAAYQYLAESIRRFPGQERFAAMIAAAGLGNVRYRNLTGGVAALHSAWRI